MSGSALIVIVAVGWIASGMVLSVALGRRGHDPISWFVMAGLFGPLALPLAAFVVRHDERTDPQTIPTPAFRRSERVRGSIDVMVGYDGSAESDAVVDEVIDLFGARLGRLKVVNVVRYNPADGDVAVARAALTALARRIAWASPEVEIAHGRPAAALAQLAADEGFAVLAVGTAGARHLFGSAAEALAHHSEVPVLLAGRPHQVA